MSHEKGALREHLDDEAEDGRIIALQSLSNAQLIQILQHHDGNDDLTQMVEDEPTAAPVDKRIFGGRWLEHCFLPWSIGLLSQIAEYLKPGFGHWSREAILKRNQPACPKNSFPGAVREKLLDGTTAVITVYWGLARGGR